MKAFILFPMSGIESAIPDHLENFFRYVADQTFDEVNCRNCFNNIFIILMTIVMKSNGIPIVRVDSGCSDYRPPKITVDIFYYS